MSEGSILRIYVATQSGGPMSGHQSVSVKSGKGIQGDRYFSNTGKNRSSYRGLPDFEITLIESEVITAFNQQTGSDFHESDFRRNLITKGIRLNDLEGKEFTVNGIQMYGVRLCEPCASLQRRLATQILPDLMGKGGLRAQIKDNGIIHLADKIS